MKYLDGTTDVTAAVTGAGLSTGFLESGQSKILTLRIKVGRAGPKTKSCLVTATSQNSPALRDVVLGQVKVKS